MNEQLRDSINRLLEDRKQMVFINSVHAAKGYGGIAKILGEDEACGLRQNIVESGKPYPQGMIVALDRAILRLRDMIEFGVTK
jgi:hypothetical protein